MRALLLSHPPVSTACAALRAPTSDFVNGQFSLLLALDWEGLSTAHLILASSLASRHDAEAIQCTMRLGSAPLAAMTRCADMRVSARLLEGLHRLPMPRAPGANRTVICSSARLAEVLINGHWQLDQYFLRLHCHCDARGHALC